MLTAAPSRGQPPGHGSIALGADPERVDATRVEVVGVVVRRVGERVGTQRRVGVVPGSVVDVVELGLLELGGLREVDVDVRAVDPVSELVQVPRPDVVRPLHGRVGEMGGVGRVGEQVWVHVREHL